MSWAVQLEGRFKPYDDVVSNTIEAAHERGESTVIVQIRGQKYIIGFADMKQKLASDTTRQHEQTVILKELQRVSGIGHKNAVELVSNHNIRDLTMLSARTDLLSRDQQIGLKHVKDFEARIPRAEVEALEKVVQAAAAAHDPPLEMTVCGSYRRGRSESGDIDCLLSHPSFVHAGGGDATWPGWIASMVRGLEKEGFLTDVISQGVKKCHAVCRLPVAADSSHAASPAVALTATAGVSTDQADAAATPGPGAPGGAAPQLPRWQDVLAKKRAGAAHAQLNMFSAWQAAKAPAPTDRDGETSGGKSGHTDGDAESGTSNGSTSSVGGKQRAAIVSSDRDTPGLALGDAFGPKGALDFGAHDESAEGQRRYRRIDLRLVPYENYFGHVLYFTGSAESNKQMRNVAIEKGFKLSEYGLFRIGEDGKEAERPESVSSEKDYFTLLGLPYKSPSERDI